MGEIIDFPDFGARQWLPIAEAIRREWGKAGVSQAGVEWILADLEPRWRRIQQPPTMATLSIEIPDKSLGPLIDEAVRKTSEVHARAMTRAMVELVRLADEIRQLKFGGPRLPDPDGDGRPPQVTFEGPKPKA